MTKKQLIDAGFEPLSDTEQHNQYNEMLNEVYGETDICGLKYEAASALLRIDPIAYDVGFNDYIDSLLGDTLVEVEDEIFSMDDVDTYNDSLED